MRLKIVMLSIAAFRPQKCASWMPGRLLECFWGVFWAPLGHPLERNWDAFSGLVPGRVPRWIWGAFGDALEGILEGFLRLSRSILRGFLEHAIHAV